MVVPPPISVIGLLPLCCSQCSIIMVEEVADMKRRRGAVITDIGRCLTFRRPAASRAFEIGTLVDEATFLQDIEKNRIYKMQSFVCDSDHSYFFHRYS